MEAGCGVFLLGRSVHLELYFKFEFLFNKIRFIKPHTSLLVSYIVRFYLGMYLGKYFKDSVPDRIVNNATYSLMVRQLDTN